MYKQKYMSGFSSACPLLCGFQSSPVSDHLIRSLVKRRQQRRWIIVLAPCSPSGTVLPAFPVFSWAIVIQCFCLCATCVVVIPVKPSMVLVWNLPCEGALFRSFTFVLCFLLQLEWFCVFTLPVWIKRACLKREIIASTRRLFTLLSSWQKLNKWIRINEHFYLFIFYWVSVSDCDNAQVKATSNWILTLILTIICSLDMQLFYLFDTSEDCVGSDKCLEKQEKLFQPGWSIFFPTACHGSSKMRTRVPWVWVPFLRWACYQLPKEGMWGCNGEIVCGPSSFCSKCRWNHRGFKGVIHCHCRRSNIQCASIACTLLTTAGRPRFGHKHSFFRLL